MKVFREYMQRHNPAGLESIDQSIKLFKLVCSIAFILFGGFCVGCVLFLMAKYYALIL